jgi:hypothetical protein
MESPVTCDRCVKPAVVFLCDIDNGKQTQVRLCIDHAEEANLPIQHASADKMRLMLERLKSGQNPPQS